MSNRVSPIVPTVGRVVLVRGQAVRIDDPSREFPALITRVWSQNCINVHVLNEEQGGKVLTSVQFHDSDETDAYSAWRWMPYQVQVAKDRDPKTGEVVAAGPAEAQVGGTGPEASTPLERVIQEAAEVGARLNKLWDFRMSKAFGQISEKHQALLNHQYNIMLAYTQILAERVLLFQSEG